MAALLTGTLAATVEAQIADARRALVKVEVMDEGLHRALEIRKSELPLKQKEAKLAKIAIQQQFRLLVSGVAIAPHEVVTPALHPTARLRVMVTFHDGSKHRASVIGTDPRTNLALVRTEVAVPHYLEPQVRKVESRQGVELVGHSMIEPMQATGFVTQVRDDGARAGHLRHSRRQDDPARRRLRGRRSHRALQSGHRPASTRTAA